MTIKRLIAICLIVVCTSLGWFFLGGTLQFRSNATDSRLSSEVTKVWGPVLEMLGVADETSAQTGNAVDNAGWNEEERAVLRAHIAERQPFLDFRFTRQKPDGSQEQFRVSGEPMFDHACRFIGYRGIGVQVFTRHD